MPVASWATPTRPRVLLSIAFGCACLAVGGGTVLAWASGRNFVGVYGLTIVLLLVAVTPMYLERKRNEFSLFNLKNLFLVYYAMQFGLWALWIITTGESKWLGDPAGSQTTLEVALAYAILGLIAFHVGYYSRLGLKIARLTPFFSARWGGPFRTSVISLILLALGLYAYREIISSWGGLTEFLSEWGQARVEAIRNKGYFLLIARYLPTIPLLIFYTKAVELRSKKYYALALSAMLIVTYIGLTLGYRAFVLYPVLQVWCIHYYLRKDSQFRLWPWLILLLVFPLVTLYSTYRSRGLKGLDTQSVLEYVESRQFGTDSGTLLVRRLSNVEVFALVIEKFEEPHYGKESVMYLLTFPIPRVLWEAKADPMAAFYKDILGGPYVGEGEASSLLGELYWNFYIPGIVGGLFTAGVFCRTAYEYLKLHLNRSALLLYNVPLVLTFWVIEVPTVACAIFVSMGSIMAVVLFFLEARVVRGWGRWLGGSAAGVVGMRGGGVSE